MNYILECFDSRNTSVDIKISCVNLEEAQTKAIDASKKSNFPVILKDKSSNGFGWEKYENGEKTEWSFNKLT
jgi:hypothetical protein